MGFDNEVEVCPLRRSNDHLIPSDFDHRVYVIIPSEEVADASTMIDGWLLKSRSYAFGYAPSFWQGHVLDIETNSWYSIGYLLGNYRVVHDFIILLDHDRVSYDLEPQLFKMLSENL